MKGGNIQYQVTKTEWIILKKLNELAEYTILN